MSHVRNRRQESPHHRARELHAFPRLRSGPLLSRGSSPPSQRYCGSSLRISTAAPFGKIASRSEEHTSELQSLMRSSYAVSCLKKNNIIHWHTGHCNIQRYHTPTLQ